MNGFFFSYNNIEEVSKSCENLFEIYDMYGTYDIVYGRYIEWISFRLILKSNALQLMWSEFSLYLSLSLY